MPRSQEAKWGCWSRFCGSRPWDLARCRMARIRRTRACILQSLFNHHLDRARVEREVAHRLVEQLALLGREAVENVFHRDVVLVTAARLLHGVLQHALPALGETVFVSSQVYHCFSFW